MIPVHFSTGHSRGPADRLLGLLAAVAVVVAGCASTPGQGDAGAEAPSAEGTVEPPAPPGSEAEALQAEVEAWLAGSDLPGVTAAVASGEGTWAGAAGVDGAGEPLAAESALGIASVTKTVTAAEVMLLAAQGVVDLDAAAEDYVAVPFDTQGATVRQLLGMRSGFPDPTDEVDQAIAADPERSWVSADWYRLVDEDEPGSGRDVDRFAYNNLNYIVLGDLIGAVTGVPYASAVRRDLLDQAGSARLWVQDAEQPAPPLAVAVEDPDLAVVDADGPWLPSLAFATAYGPAGAIAADAASLADWGLALYTGPLLDSQSVQEMTSASGVTGYGLGTEVWQDDAGDLIVGHTGGYAYRPVSLLAVWPGDQVAVAVLSPRGADRPLESLALLLHDTSVGG